MTAPATNKCLDCKGIGLKVREVPTKLYTCGFYTAAYPCPTCLGTGRIMPVSLQDSKTASTGDAL